MALREKLAELVVDVTARLSPLKGHLAKANAMMKRGLGNMVRMARRAGKWIGVGLVAALAWATRAAMIQEEAELDLAAALRQTGDATEENIKRLKEFASGLQKITTYGDEFTLALVSQLKNLGVHTDRLEEATKMVLGLSAATGRDTKTMIMAVAAYEEGDAELLRRYIPALRGATNATEKLNLVSALSARGFKVLKERADSTRSVLTRLWNIIGDTAEKIAAPLLPKIKEVAVALGRWLIKNEKLMATGFGKWVKATTTILALLVVPLKWLTNHARFATIALIALVAVPVLPMIVGLIKAVGFLAKGFVRVGKGVYNLIRLLMVMSGLAVIDLSAAAEFRKVFTRETGQAFNAVRAFQWQLWKLSRTLRDLPGTLAKVGRTIITHLRHPLQSVLILLTRLRIAALKTSLVAVTGISKVGVAIKALFVALRGMTIAGLAMAAGFTVVFAGIVAGIIFIVVQLNRWRKALWTIFKHRDQLGKQRTFEERAALAAATREQRELKRKERLLKLEKKRAEATAARALEEAEAAKASEIADKDALEAHLAFLEKVGGYSGKVAELKEKLRAVEAQEIAEAADLEVGAVRRELDATAAALQKAETAEKRKERQAEYTEKLQMLKELFTGEARFANELAAIKKKLRHQEALDVQKAAPWLDLETIKSMLAAKQAPVEIARAGLTGLQAAWGGIATGTQRTQEEQLRALERIAVSVERQEEIAASAGGMQTMSTPRY